MYRIGYKDLSVEQRRALDKQYVKFKRLGHGRLVDAQPVQDQILKLVDSGMSCRQIADLADMDPCRVRCIKRGIGRHGHPLYQVRRSTYDAIMAITYEAPQSFGQRIDPTGIRRRLQGMRADGFPLRIISGLVGIDADMLHRISNEEHEYTYTATHQKVADMYDRYLIKTPVDVGYTNQGGISRAKSNAKRNGFVPRHVWDSDTIDDPAAFPEWTGECGSLLGAHLHRKYGMMPLCRPCVDARNARRRELGYPGRRGRDDG